VSSFATHREGELERVTSIWWVFLVTGSLWMLVSLLVLRFNYTSVSAISILFGCIAIAMGVNEFFHVGSSTSGWKIVHVLLGLALIVIGIIAFVHPGDTFEALAAVMSFFLVLKGTFDIVMSLIMRHDAELWWLTLIVGVIELLLGFWAAGYFGRSVVLLVVWIGATALTRGITDVLQAFALRKALHAA
jgi:uncharacterized membrane protein HdeD (DUF308 family)